MTAQQNDKNWLEKQLNREVSYDEIYSFSERVGILICDEEMDEDQARELTMRTWINERL